MVIDFHTHIFPPWPKDDRRRFLERDATFAELYADPEESLATAEELIEAMDKDGVDKSVVMGIGWSDHALAREANDYIIEAVARHPQRLVGLAGVNPAWGDRAAREAVRCAQAGLRGIGELHPDSQSFDLGDRQAMAPLMDVVRQYKLIVVTHSSEPVGHLYHGKGNTGPKVLWSFIQNFPDVKIVCAHWGGGLPFYALMPEVADGLGNAYFDTAASPFLYKGGVYLAVAGLVGPTRILFGSDFPLLRASRLLREIRRSALSEVEKEVVMGGNAAALLRG